MALEFVHEVSFLSNLQVTVLVLPHFYQATQHGFFNSLICW